MSDARRILQAGGVRFDEMAIVIRSQQHWRAEHARGPEFRTSIAAPPS
jgi:hypothetical protein